jgi:VCBS repeat-containing protein
MRRHLIVLATMALLPVVSSGSASAIGGPTLTPASATYTDTVAWERFADATGSITGVTASPADLALVGGTAAVEPPNTNTLTYTKMKVGTYGTMFLGSANFAYVVDNDAINALGAGASVTDAFTFDADGDASTTGDQTVFTVSLAGADDAPTISTVLDDFTDGVTPAAVSTSSASSRVPAGEQAINAFDGSTATKYLNFDKGGSDLKVDVGAPYVLTAVGLTTGNDEPGRDPTKIRLYGSATSLDALTEIGTEVTLTPPSGRGVDYPNLAVSNSTAYRYYRIVFTEISNAGSANSMQIAEVRLSGYPESQIQRYTPGDPALTFSGPVTLFDENTTSLTATISENLVTGDVLGCGACAENSITATWAAPTLTLMADGSPTRANWQAAARSLTFLRPDAVGTTGPTITLSLSDGGSTPGTATIDIEIVRLQPSIGVPTPSVTATVGTAIEPFTPTNAGDAASWAISPALPAGLSLDPDTGQISGTPTATAVATEYTLTATNTVGSDTETFTLTVLDPPVVDPPIIELPATGSDTGALVALLAVAVGYLILIGTRRRRPTA